MTTALLVYAHCDDELLWGHPFLLDRSVQRRVLICSDDSTNPARQAYRRGPEALAAVCDAVGIREFRTLPYHSEFYRLRTRGVGEGPLLMNWWDDAAHALKTMSEGCDFIATHSPHFEYGHLDHMMVRRVVMETACVPPKWTDARVATSTWPIGHRWIAAEDIEGVVRTPRADFDRLKWEYVSRDCWTWSSEEPLEVQVVRERL